MSSWIKCGLTPVMTQLLIRLLCGLSIDLHNLGKVPLWLIWIILHSVFSFWISHYQWSTHGSYLLKAERSAFKNLKSYITWIISWFKILHIVVKMLPNQYNEICPCLVRDFFDFFELNFITVNVNLLVHCWSFVVVKISKDLFIHE